MWFLALGYASHLLSLSFSLDHFDFPSSYLPWHETFYKVLNQIAELANKEDVSKDFSLALLTL